MPKLPHISGGETLRRLERLGFSVVRQRGSHIVMQRGTVGCVLLNHRELKVGPLTGVLRQAAVSVEEFVEAQHIGLSILATLPRRLVQRSAPVSVPQHLLRGRHDSWCGLTPSGHQ